MFPPHAPIPSIRPSLPRKPHDSPSPPPSPAIEARRRLQPGDPGSDSGDRLPPRRSLSVPDPATTPCRSTAAHPACLSGLRPLLFSGAGNTQLASPPSPPSPPPFPASSSRSRYRLSFNLSTSKTSSLSPLLFSSLLLACFMFAEIPLGNLLPLPTTSAPSPDADDLCSRRPSLGRQLAEQAAAASRPQQASSAACAARFIRLPSSLPFRRPCKQLPLCRLPVRRPLLPLSRPPSPSLPPRLPLCLPLRRPVQFRPNDTNRPQR